MKMYDEIKKISNALFPSELTLSGGGGYFTGVKKILCFNNSQISVLLGECKMHVYGECLKVVKLMDGDLAFTGNVLKTEREKL